MSMIGANNTENQAVLAEPAPEDERPPDEQEDDRIGRFSRRNLLRWAIGLGFGAYAFAFTLPALALQALRQERREIAAGDELVYTSAAGAQAGQPIRAGEIREGSGVQAFPRGKDEDQNNLINLVRVGSGNGAEGLVAYSAICTHLGCAVYANLNERGHIACPCHNSQFDPAADARPVGGPANRPLPSLPINVNAEGTIVAAGPFNGQVGPS